MKKLFLIIASIFCIGNICFGQNSEVEAKQFETKAERFIKKCLYYKTETFNKSWQGDLNVYAKVTTDLTTMEKVGYLYFETESTVDGSAVSLGYLDMDEVDDLLQALNRVVESSKEKQYAKSYSINYVTHGGIDFTFYCEKNGKIWVRKEWNTINRYGTSVSYKIYNEAMEMKDLVGFIDVIKESKDIVNQNLN